MKMKIQVDKTSVEIPRAQSNKFIDLTGKKFGMLTVIKRAENNKAGGTVWLCKCDCGNEREVVRGNLKSGNTKSCGCYKRTLNKRFIGKSILSLSSDSKSPTEEKKVFRTLEVAPSRHPLYVVWSNMIARCNNPLNKRYSRYGGRGIAVCEEWKHARPFIEWGLNSGWRLGLQIDRIDNDKGYYPNNCRFVTPTENAHNKPPVRRNNTSGYCGVSFHRDKNKFQSRISYGEFKDLHLGFFDSVEEAALIRDKFIIENNLPHRLQVIERPRTCS